jgi:hypothetical protein
MEGGADGSDHEESSDDRSSDIMVTTADKQDLVVSVYEITGNDSNPGEMKLSISNTRPGTALGRIQGDHVTAYKCFLEMLMVAVEGKPLRLCARIIAETAMSVLPDQKVGFNLILSNLTDEIKSICSRKERHQLLEKLDRNEDREVIARLDTSLKLSRKAVFRKIVEQIGQTFICQINLDEETAFTRIGPMDRSQGSRVKVAIHALKAINDFIAIYKNPDCSKKQWDSFYSNYIVVNAPYKDGANAIFGK